jgi:cystathionine beta-lyase
MASYSFDDVSVETLLRRGTLKWSLYGPDVLALWVAEMDFRTAPPVMDALRSAVEREEFGYPFEGPDSGMPEALASWQKRRYGWEIDPGGVVTLPDVLKGVELALDTFTPAGSPVVVPTPAYMPFFDVLNALRRPIVEVPAALDGDVRRLDLDGISTAFGQGAASLILCNPHNPLGRSYATEELAGLAEIVEVHAARVVSDEIHGPLTYPGGRHVPYATVSPAARAHSTTLVSATKGWNLPGLKCAQMILTNDVDRERWRAVPPIRSHGASTLGIRATLAAYREGEEWLDEVLRYLDSNRYLLKQLLAEMLPDVGYAVPEATYLAWRDFTAMNLQGESAQVIRERARVATNPGSAFRGDGPGHVRLNFATSRSILTQAVERIAGALGR